MFGFLIPSQFQLIYWVIWFCLSYTQDIFFYIKCPFISIYSFSLPTFLFHHLSLPVKFLTLLFVSFVCFFFWWAVFYCMLSCLYPHQVIWIPSTYNISWGVSLHPTTDWFFFCLVFLPLITTTIHLFVSFLPSSPIWEAVLSPACHNLVDLLSCFSLLHAHTRVLLQFHQPLKLSL